MGGRGSAGRHLPTPPTATGQPPNAGKGKAGANVRDLTGHDVWEELDDLRYTADKRELTPAEQARHDALTTEHHRREAITGAARRAKDAASLAGDHDEWRAEHGPDTPDEAHLRRTLIDLTTQRDPRGEVAVSIAQARAALPDLSRDQFDTALRGILGDPAVFLAPETDQKALTPADREAAIMVGGKPKHLLRAQDFHLEAARAEQDRAAVVRERVRAAYGQVAAQPNEWVSITTLRSLLSDVPRAEVDQAIADLERTPGVSVVPEVNQKSLTQQDRNAAVHIGGKAKHLIALSAESTADPARRHDDVSDAAEQAGAHAAWRDQHGPDTPPEARLRAALLGLTRETSQRDNEFVHLDTVRAALPDMPRAEFDTALRALQRDPDITLVPDSAQGRLTPAQKAAALRLGGEDKHMIRAVDSRTDLTGLDAEDQR